MKDTESSATRRSKGPGQVAIRVPTDPILVREDLASF